eukprot:Amastigsp_a849212_59.p3 type:complete len:158 gc:universal Amastigsp_a849212_59:579-106(-)
MRGDRAQRDFEGALGAWRRGYGLLAFAAGPQNKGHDFCVRVLDEFLDGGAGLCAEEHTNKDKKPAALGFALAHRDKVAQLGCGLEEHGLKSSEGSEISPALERLDRDSCACTALVDNRVVFACDHDDCHLMRPGDEKVERKIERAPRCVARVDGNNN